MLNELPALAERLKAFVRDNPLKESMYGEAESLSGTSAFVADLLTKAAKASRATLTFEVENTRLRLADLRSFENRTNTVGIPQLPGIGPGLLRVVGFEMGRSWASFHLPVGEQAMFVKVEHSPLGWPELPDMATADLNVLFEKAEAQADDDSWLGREALL